MEPAEQLPAIARAVQSCTNCPLHEGARQGVPGSGDPHAALMFIGEAPSLYDDKSGDPFSGPTGVFLDELLALVGLERGQVFLTNVVKHRLPANRELELDEIAACADYLTRQIAAINPRVIVTLGRYAMARYFPKAKISKMHGTLKTMGGRVILVLYNPAAALHQVALRQTVIDDFLRGVPAALAAAERLATAGTVNPTDPSDEPPAQLSLF
jgi:DNA polymerase